MFSATISPDAELRLLELHHVEQLHALAEGNREHLRRWLPWAQHAQSVEDTRSFVRGALAQFAAGDGFHAGIWHQGQLAGGIGLHKIDWRNRAVSLGYWISKEHQGRGLVTMACQALIAHLFGGLKLNRVEIRCAVENARSRRIPERLGFQQEGVLRQAEKHADRYVDVVVYSMLAEDFFNTQRDKEAT